VSHAGYSTVMLRTSAQGKWQAKDPGIRLQYVGSDARASQLFKLLQPVEQFLIFRLSLNERGFEILDDFGGSLAAKALIG